MIVIMAWRNIWRNKTRSIVIMLSVAIGLLAGMSVLSLYNGMMVSRIRMVIDSEVSHLQLHHPQFRDDFHPKFIIQQSNQILEKIRSSSSVKFAAPRTITQGMLITTTGSTGVQVNGIIPSIENSISQLDKKIIEGDGFHQEKKNEIIIGKKLAGKMKLKPGSKLVLTFTDSSDNIVSSAFRVSSIYQSGNAPLDEVNVYVPMNTLNELLLIGNSFHEIAILLYADDQVPIAKSAFKSAYPLLLVESWKEISPETDFMVRTVDDYSYIIMLIILIALAFGILNTMLMSVLERTREIGMMVALGTSKAKIFFLVFLETVFLTIAGTPVGLLISWVIINYYNKNGLDLSFMGEDLMQSFGYNPMIYPSFPWEQLAVVLLMVIGTAIISCLMPALKALRLQPVEALRR